ncbi:MAG: hypothetical protein N2645_13870 [Clostridia bacterium]|nr:hypothetical protein [Clostridia bacterium]
MNCKICGEEMETKYIPEPSEEANNAFKIVYTCNKCIKKETKNN